MKRQRIISMVLGVLFVTTLFVGCGSKTSSTSSTTESSTSSAAPAEKMELSVAIWGIQDGFNDPNAKNDKVYDDLCSKLNITIKPVQITWNDWQDKTKIWAASDQLPDIFAGTTAEDTPAIYSSWAKQGVIKQIPQDLTKYPNISKMMSKPAVKPLNADGKYYMVPRGSARPDVDTPSTSRSFLYRKDWAKQAGFNSAPQSFDELVTMTQAVMKQHPNTVGLSINNPNYLGTVFLWSFPEAANESSWVKENGKWIPSLASTKTADGIKQLKTLYTDGILDKDFIIQKDADGFNKFVTGKSFSCFSTTGVDVTKFAASNPGVKQVDAVGVVEPFALADGNRYNFTGTPYWSETLFSNKMDDKKFDRALKLVDYMFSEEYITQKSNGILGTDWKMDGDKAVSLLPADQTISKKYPITGSLCWLSTWDGVIDPAKTVYSTNPDQAAYDKFINIDTMNQLKKDVKNTQINFDVMLMNTPAKTKIGNFHSDAMSELSKIIIKKEDPIKLWQDFITGYNAKGLTEAIDEVTAQAEKQGIK